MLNEVGTLCTFLFVLLFLRYAFQTGLIAYSIRYKYAKKITYRQTVALQRRK